MRDFREAKQSLLVDGVLFVTLAKLAPIPILETSFGRRALCLSPPNCTASSGGVSIRQNAG